jgi:hypothetical protein
MEEEHSKRLMLLELQLNQFKYLQWPQVESLKVRMEVLEQGQKDS